MNDRAVSLLEEYDLEVLSTRKGRGAILAETDRGWVTFQEYMGHPSGICMQELLLQKLSEAGLFRTERLIATKKGALLTVDRDGKYYFLKTYLPGRECGGRPEDVIRAMELLAGIHNLTETVEAMDESGRRTWSTQNGEHVPVVREVTVPKGEDDDPDAEPEKVIEKPFPPVPGVCPQIDCLREFEKHGRELRTIQNYLAKRGNKTDFEYALAVKLEEYIPVAYEVTERYRQNRQQEPAGEPGKILYCHGDYQYHNILYDDNGFFVINFEKYTRDYNAGDICLLMRKILEKNNWSLRLGCLMLDAYDRVRPLSDAELTEIVIRLSFPEKFWKIANFYYNTAKSFLSRKNMEKLEALSGQEAARREFLNYLQS